MHVTFSSFKVPSTLNNNQVLLSLYLLRVYYTIFLTVTDALDHFMSYFQSQDFTSTLTLTDTHVDFMRLTDAEEGLLSSFQFHCVTSTLNNYQGFMSSFYFQDFTSTQTTTDAAPLTTGWPRSSGSSGTGPTSNRHTRFEKIYDSEFSKLYLLAVSYCILVVSTGKSANGSRRPLEC